MPPDPGTGVIADEESLEELARLEAGELLRARCDLMQPIWNRFGGREPARLEIIAAAIAVRQPLACPLLEAKGSQFCSVDRLD